MINPVAATVILVVFILIFGVGVPVLDRKVPKYISFRWCVVVVILALLIGAVIDFDVLSDEARKIVLIGGLIIAGVYVFLRTIEKILANGWLRGASIEIEKGDIKAKVHSQDTSEDKPVK